MGNIFKIDKNEISSYHLYTDWYHSNFDKIIYLLNNDPENGPRQLAEGNFPIAYIVNSTRQLASKIKDHLLTDVNIPIDFSFNIQEAAKIDATHFTDLINSFHSNNIPETLYPTAVRYITSSGYYIIERPPFKTAVDFRVNGKSKITQKAEIWVPWTLTAINKKHPGDTRIFFGHEPLKDFSNSKYIASTLPNSYIDGRICFGTSLSNENIDQALNNNDINYLYSLILNEYMSGGWNIDLFPTIARYTNYYTGTSNKNKESMIYQYHKLDFDKIKKIYPSMRLSSIQGMQTRHELGHTNRVEMFKFMFFSLSRFSLEETLEFYKEIIASKNKNHNEVSFKQIVEDLEHEGKNNHYRSLNHSLISQLGNIPNISTYRSIALKIIIKNYGKDPKVVQFGSSGTNKRSLLDDVYPKTVSAIFNHCLEQDDLFPLYIINGKEDDQSFEYTYNGSLSFNDVYMRQVLENSVPYVKEPVL